MAKKLKTFEFRQTASKYNWDEWFNGEIWELKRGEDFQNPANYFRSQVSSRARERGLRAMTSQVGEDTVVSCCPISSLRS